MNRLISLFLLFLLSAGMGFGVSPGQAKAEPVGTVISYYGTTAPDGYFVCNGATFDAASFPKLHAVLGTNVLPDLRGYFIRGADTRNTVDPDGATRALGSVQGDAIRNIRGHVQTGTSTAGINIYGASGAFYKGQTTVQTMKLNSGVVGDPVFRFDASKVVPTAAENRPQNKTLLYCIKHDEGDVPVPGGIPNLRVGQETLWPVRYEGKQVYAKLVNFGTLPAGYGVKGTLHTIQNVDWIQIAWDYSSIRKANDVNKVTHGLVSTPVPTGAMQWRFFVDVTTIQAHGLTAASSADWSGVICVLYTKTTD